MLTDAGPRHAAWNLEADQPVRQYLRADGEIHQRLCREWSVISLMRRLIPLSGWVGAGATKAWAYSSKTGGCWCIRS